MQRIGPWLTLLLNNESVVDATTLIALTFWEFIGPLQPQTSFGVGVSECVTIVGYVQTGIALHIKDGEAEKRSYADSQEVCYDS